MEPQKIDLDKAKRLNRIMEGKEKPIRQEKIDRLMEEARGKILLGETEKLLTEAQKLLTKNMQTDPGLELDSVLIAFRGKYHFFEGTKHQKLNESEVRQKIADRSKIELYYICTNDGMCPLPAVLKDKGAKGMQVKDDAGVISFIKDLTGVEITKKDL